MDGLVPGRIVYYVFDEKTAAEVNRRRTTGASIASRMKNTIRMLPDGEPIAAWPAGAQAHIGPDVHGGDVQPAMVVAVLSSDASEGIVNLKVQLNGSDEYWAVDVPYAKLPAGHSWHWMYEGQARRGERK